VFYLALPTLEKEMADGIATDFLIVCAPTLEVVEQTDGFRHLFSHVRGKSLQAEIMRGLSWQRRRVFALLQTIQSQFSR
jgi:nicotinamide riboside kinase